MSKPWRYIIVIAALVVAGIGIAGIVLSCGSPRIFVQGADLATQLQAARSLCEEVVEVPVGSFIVVATPFQFAYVVLSFGLVSFALVVCLLDFLFERYQSHHHLHFPSLRIDR